MLLVRLCCCDLIWFDSPLSSTPAVLYQRSLAGYNNLVSLPVLLLLFRLDLSKRKDLNGFRDEFVLVTGMHLRGSGSFSPGLTFLLYFEFSVLEN
jgi:hypothetical protein